MTVCAENLEGQFVDVFRFDGTFAYVPTEKRRFDAVLARDG